MTATAAKHLTADELRVLSHYATGTPLSAIATMLGRDVEEVRDTVNRLTGFERAKAGDLVRAHKRTATAPAKTTTPPRAAAAGPAGPVDVGQRPILTGPLPTPLPEPAIEEPADADSPAEPQGIEAILARAEAVGGLLAVRAHHIRDLTTRLAADTAHSAEFTAAEQRVAEARRQLDAANARLRTLRYGDVPADTLLRRWAAANQVPCPRVGYVGKKVVAAWKDAGSPDLSEHIEEATG